MKYLYEERITLWRAANLDEALDKAIDEAESYAKDMDAPYIGFAQGFWMFSKLKGTSGNHATDDLQKM